MSLSKLGQCSVGKITTAECHKLNYTKVTQVIKFDELSEHDRNLLRARIVKNSDLAIIDICEHHKEYYLNRYSNDSCYDPYTKHRVKVRTSLRTIKEEFAEEINGIIGVTKCVAEQQICNNCRIMITREILTKKTNETTNQQESSTSASEASQNTPDFFQEDVKEEAQDVLNFMLRKVNQSPIKLHAVSSKQRQSLGKRKAETLCSEVKKKFSNVLGSNFWDEPETVSSEVEQKAANFDALIELIKEKIASGISRREKIQLLTLAPISWTADKVQSTFNVSNYAVRLARSLLKNEGLLALPKPRNGRKLDGNTVLIVKNFYENDEYSRIMPGQKDKVSIAKNTYEQKRLLLSNLNELYTSFKFDYPHCKVGFSKFCSLRPKWCVLSGSSGTHSICVCVIHQNVKLLLAACEIEETYHELIEYLVCSPENKDCMLRYCPNCPDNTRLKEFLINKFEEWDPDDEVTYSMWISTDRSQKATITVPLGEYVETLVTSLESLIPHSYIAKSQSKFLKEKKSNLRPHEAIVLLDFSQNYSYCFQDEVQGHYWARESCSLHPAVLYTHSGETEPVKTSMCMISDDLDHDVPFVYETQKAITQSIKENFPAVKHINYFSDGCAQQYKNCKNFTNLCHHYEDFQLSASWTFFATSHGKSACDGVGGTTKRLVRKASLQINCRESIDTAKKVYKFCEQHIENIKYWFLSTEKISESRCQLENRFALAKTVPGTRSYHQFEPVSSSSIRMKRESCSSHFNTFNFTEEEKSTSIKVDDILINSYLACSIDDHWFYGIALSKDENELEVEVKLMRPYGPSPSFFWPSDREKVVFVPVTDIITCVEPPKVNASGRAYTFSTKETSFVVREFAMRFS